MGARVFISYGRNDGAEFAAGLAAWLASRGLEPWLDVDEGIPIGAPFDVRIEIGIAGSQVLVALLTPGSVRCDGFCRRELLFAQAKKVPIVPVRLADVCPPIQIISLNYLDAAQKPEDVFDRLLAAIEKAIGQHRSELRDWAATCAGNPWWAERPRLDFQEELARRGDVFVGREWLFREIREGIADEAVRLLFVVGAPGMGKSAIAAQLTTQLDVRGIHFCSRSNAQSCRPGTWLATVVFQLAAQFPAYRERIEQMSPPTWEEAPSALFRALIADPLEALRQRLDVAGPWVFVIDALDEATAVCGTGFADLLAESLERSPRWLRFVVTSRPDRRLTARFRLPGVRRLRLAARDPRNLSDLQAYAARRLEVTPQKETAPALGSTVAERLASGAAGNFLVARLSLDALADPDPEFRLAAGDLGRLPARLGGLFHAMFRQRFPDPERYQAEVAPLLACLTAALGPVPEKLLLTAAVTEPRAARRGLLSLSQFLETRREGLTVFHGSLAEWLHDAEASGEFHCEPDAGHRLLADACWQEHERRPASMGTYEVRHALAHLRLDGRLEALFKLAEDDRFLRQLLHAEGPATLRRELVAAIAEASAAGTLDRILAIRPASAGLARALVLRQDGPVDEAVRLLEDAAAGTSTILAGIAWLELGWLHKDRDASPDRSEVLKRALAALRQAENLVSNLGYDGLMAETVRSLGWMLKDLGKDDEAAAAFHCALRLCERLNVAVQVAWTERDLGAFYRDQHRWPEGLAHLGRALDLFRRHGDSANLAVTLKDLGLLHLARSARSPTAEPGGLAAARRALEEAEEVARAAGDHDLEGWTRRYRGITAALSGDVARGRRLIAESGARFERFVAANRALGRLCAARAAEIRQPELLELYGHEPTSRTSYDDLFREET